MMRVALWIAIVVAGLLTVRALGDGAVAAGDSPRQDGPRQDTLLDDGWRFVREDVPGAEAPQFDDSSWQKVTLPHTWNAQDAQSGPNYYRGPGWYRKRITLNENDLARINYLRFEGASIVADVYMNGQKLGQHRGAFGAFCFNATPAQQFGENVIAVRVDNTKFPDIAPISGDFAIFGGFYRDVHLLSLDKRSIDPLDDASPGVYLLQEEVTPQRARVKVTVRLRNTSRSPWDAKVRCTIAGPKDTTVEEWMEMAGAVSVQETSRVIEMQSPILWDGHRSSSAPKPSLYTVTIETLDGDRITDRITQPLGLRSIRLDPDKGLFLNGEHYALHGANRHQDRQDKGWAISHADQDKDFDLLLEMGSTGVRLAHYQHSDYAYSLCDKNGLLVWAEIPLVDKIAPTPEFAANAKQQLRELIKQNFNHPSIICWSISNELWMGRDQNNGSTLPAELYSLAKSLDLSRPIVLADNGGPADDFNTITDAIAFNRYYGWYVDTADDWGSEKGIDGLHRAFPKRPVGISEYGAGANPEHHEWPTQMPRHNGPWHPEEYQALLHEKAWNVMKTRDWLWCIFFWNGFDFATPVRQEGGFQSRNDKGL
ncbi:MAG: beta galactosidase jelly roll domain-containing protein, partial [Phycisphaeraceae bacterium]|nr:beta galactosidase jelly roll domain-containing protein [Phycisphaeraceae bacterium]